MSTLSANLEAFLRACRAKQLKPRTRKWYDWLLSNYCEYVEAGGLRWDDPDTLDVFFGDHLPGQELSESTNHAYYRVLRRFFNWLEKRRRLPGDNPIPLIEPPKKPRAQPRRIEQEEVETLLAAIDGDTRQDERDRAIILFLWDTGVRVTELCDLEVRDLDLKRKRATIRKGKGDKGRTVRFGDRARELLTAWRETEEVWSREHGRADCGRVFVNRSGRPLTRRGVSQMLGRRQAYAGIEGPCNPHAFRHGFAVAYLDNGGNIHNLQHLMGHVSLRSTEPYLESTDERAEKDHAKASPGDHLNGG
jgi:site-specific recombinase XerD